MLAKTNAADADGEVVWSCAPMLAQVSREASFCRDDGGKKPVIGESSEYV